MRPAQRLQSLIPAVISLGFIAVTKPSTFSASCISSASRTCGHASSRTPAIASGRAAQIVGAARRRSSGGSAPPGCAALPVAHRRGTHTARVEHFGGERAGAGEVARHDADLAAFQSTQHLQQPSVSIASRRQSCMVWLTSGWSGTSRSPTMFSMQAT
jgi:hypothetical protein